MNVPKQHKLITLKGGHGELEKQYIYKDSSKLYISDFGQSMLNYDNILSLGDSMANERFEALDLKAKLAEELGREYRLKTIILEGKTKNGHYWKDVRLGVLSIGYVGVSEKRKAEFEKALNSLKRL